MTKETKRIAHSYGAINCSAASHAPRATNDERRTTNDDLSATNHAPRATPQSGPNDESGFTLIELIMVIVMSAILSGLFVNVFSLGTNIFSLMSSSQDVNQTKRVIISRIGSEIRTADSVTITSPTDMTLNTDIDSDGDLEAVRYYISGGDLRKSIDGASDSVLLENANISFTGSGNRIVIAASFTYSGVTTNIRTGILQRRAM